MTPADILARAEDAQALVDTLEGIEGERAPLHAAHGYGGTWEARRKILLATLKNDMRNGATGRISEASLDDAARADERYVRFIERGEAERVRLAQLDAQRVALEHRIALAKSLMYTHGRLAGLV